MDFLIAPQHRWIYVAIFSVMAVSGFQIFQNLNNVNVSANLYLNLFLKMCKFPKFNSILCLLSLPPSLPPSLFPVPLTPLSPVCPSSHLASVCNHDHVVAVFSSVWLCWCCSPSSGSYDGSHLLPSLVSSLHVFCINFVCSGGSIGPWWLCSNGSWE